MSEILLSAFEFHEYLGSGHLYWRCFSFESLTYIYDIVNSAKNSINIGIDKKDYFRPGQTMGHYQDIQKQTNQRRPHGLICDFLSIMFNIMR